MAWKLSLFMCLLAVCFTYGDSQLATDNLLSTETAVRVLRTNFDGVADKIKRVSPNAYSMGNLALKSYEENLNYIKSFVPKDLLHKLFPVIRFGVSVARIATDYAHLQDIWENINKAEIFMGDARRKEKIQKSITELSSRINSFAKDIEAKVNQEMTKEQIDRFYDIQSKQRDYLTERVLEVKRWIENLETEANGYIITLKNYQQQSILSKADHVVSGLGLGYQLFGETNLLVGGINALLSAGHFTLFGTHVYLTHKSEEVIKRLSDELEHISKLSDRLEKCDKNLQNAIDKFNKIVF